MDLNEMMAETQIQLMTAKAQAQSQSAQESTATRTEQAYSEFPTAVFTQLAAAALTQSAFPTAWQILPTS